jgi:O-antigen ligase
MVISVLCGLAAILGYAVFHQGGVYSEHWNICLLGLGLLTVIYSLGTRGPDRAPKLDRALWWLTLLLPAYVGFQLLPLPEMALKMLSPQRARLLLALQQTDASISWAPLTVVPPETLAQALRIAACVVTFLLIRELAWRWPERRWTLALPIVGIAVLEAALGLSQASSGGADHFASGTYKNRNHFAGLLEMALPFAVMQAAAIISRRERGGELPLGSALKAGALLVCAAVMFLGVVRSSSRMGFISCLASLFVLGAFRFSAAFPRSKGWLAIGAPAAVVVAIFIFLTPASLIVRFGALASEGELTAESRLVIWRDTMRLVAAYPVFGCGMGGFEPALLPYKTSLPMSTVNFAHNDYLQLAAELGLLGFAMVAALVILLMRPVVQAVLDGGEVHFLALACLGAIVAILLHSLGDFNMYVPANSLVFAWIAGLASSLSFQVREIT